MDVLNHDIGHFESWCRAYVERVPLSEARRVPYFEVAARAYSIWWSMSPAGLPCRQQLDPCRFGPALLPQLSLIELLEHGADYYWRLCGEQATYVIGTRLAGKRLSTIEDELNEAVYFRWALDDVAEYAEPMFYVLRHRTVGGCPKRTYGVLLPLCDAQDVARGGERPVRYALGACDWVSDL